jgi:hypothetical protein
MRAVHRDQGARRWALSGAAIIVVLLLARWTGDGLGNTVPLRAQRNERVDRTARNASNSILEGRHEATGATDSIGESETSAGFAAVDSGPTTNGPAMQSELDPIYLERLSVRGGGKTFALNGLDPYAPRELVAWRIIDGHAVLMSRGSSDSDGAIRFPKILAPRDGFEVVVSEAGTRPESLGASDRRRLAPRMPVAPHAQVFGEAGAYQMHIVPTETSGEVLLADFTGNVFASYEVPSHHAPSSRVIDLAITLPETDTQIWLAHQLEGGRVSEWRVLSLPQGDADSQLDP